jgi:hypothetical protein
MMYIGIKRRSQLFVASCALEIKENILECTTNDLPQAIIATQHA